MSVRAGSSYHNTGGTIIAVAQIYQHTQFNVDTYDYDISVLRLKSSLKLGTNIAIITMISASTAIKDGDLAVATGWGRLTNEGIVPTQLQTVSLPTITTSSCAAYYGTGVGGITERMFCAGYAEGGKDTCQVCRRLPSNKLDLLKIQTIQEWLLNGNSEHEDTEVSLRVFYKGEI